MFLHTCEFLILKNANLLKITAILRLTELTQIPYILHRWLGNEAVKLTSTQCWGYKTEQLYI